MKRELLERIVAVQAGKRTAVLIHNLSGSDQVLIGEDDVHGDAENIPAELSQAGREALGRDGASTLEVAGQRYLLQTFAPPPRVVIVGAVHIAQQLIPMARMTGFDVTLIDPRTAFAVPERFPGVDVITDWPQEVMAKLSLDARTAVVTLSHDPKIDEPALHAALESRAFYIGALGSRKNHANRLERLAAAGFDEDALRRIAGPIGLPLGGRAPAEIAVSILAQIIQSRYRQQVWLQKVTASP